MPLSPLLRCVCILPVAAFTLATTPRAVSDPTVSAGVVLAPDDAALDGVRFGAHEAQQAARLFGASFTLHEAVAADAEAAATAARALIEQHGVTIIFGGSDDAAASALARAAQQAGVLFVNVGATADSLRLACAPLVFHTAPSYTMLGDALRITDAPAGATAVAWHHRLVRYGAGQVNDRFADMFGRPIDARAWTGWLGVKVVWEAALRARSSTAADIAARLTADDIVFDGHKGIPLSFRSRTHQLRQPLYVIQGDSVIAEIPSPRDDPDVDHVQLLDRIGNQEGAAPCAR